MPARIGGTGNGSGHREGLQPRAAPRRPLPSEQPERGAICATGDGNADVATKHRWCWQRQAATPVAAAGAVPEGCVQAVLEFCCRQGPPPAHHWQQGANSLAHW